MSSSLRRRAAIAAFPAPSRRRGGRAVALPALAIAVVAGGAVVAALAAPLHAQHAASGRLTGRVTDAAEQPLAGATLLLRQADGSYPRTVRSDPHGEFRFYFIPPGLYDLEVRLIGYRPLTVREVDVEATATRRLAVRLTPATTELATLTVSAGALSVNRASTAFTTSLAARERERLPTSRNANDLVAFVPAARPGQLYGGSTNQANLYQLDGVMVNAPGTGGSFLIPSVDWLEEFTVVALGAGAEYGNFQGGLVNLVTKSGSNTRRGQLRVFAEDAAWNATNVNAFENGADQAGRLEVNGEWRGPIRRDRLYYYVSGIAVRSGTRVVDFRRGTVRQPAFLPEQSTRDEHKLYGKLSWQPSSRDLVHASVGLDAVSRERVGLNGFDAPEATTRGRSPAVFSQANWQRTLGDQAYLEVRLSGYAGRDDQLAYGGEDQPAVRLLDVSGSPLYANAIWTRTSAPRSVGSTVTLDRHLRTGPAAHRVKLGGEYGLGLWREVRRRNGGLSWYTQPRIGVPFDPLDAATWAPIPSIGGGRYATADTGGSIDLVADTRNAALFLQDDLQLGDRLTLSAGVRWNAWTGSITPGHGGGSRGTAPFRAVQATGVDPRIGATLDPTGRGTVVAKVHWGRYHQSLFALFYDRAPGANVFTPVAYCNWNDVSGAARPDPRRPYPAAEFDARFGCTPGTNLITEATAIEGYRQPHMDQWTAGLEKTIGSRLKATLVWVDRRNRAVLALVDRDLERNWRPLRDVAVYDGFRRALDASGQPLALPTLWVRADDLRRRLAFGATGANEIPGYTQADTLALPRSYAPSLVLRPVDGARRAFRQWQLGLAGQWPRATFDVTVARSTLTGNVFGVNGYFDPNGEGFGPFVEPNRAEFFDGRLENLAPWDLRARASGLLPWGIEGGAWMNVRTGDFWTPTYTVPRTPDYRMANARGDELRLSPDLFTGVIGQQLFVERRGARQLATFATVDLRLQRGFTVGRTSLVAGLEVFNALNAQSITEVKTSVNTQVLGDPTSRPGAVRLRQAPQVLRLNAQFRW